MAIKQIASKKSQKGALLLIRMVDANLTGDHYCSGHIRLRRIDNGKPDKNTAFEDIYSADRWLLPDERSLRIWKRLFFIGSRTPPPMPGPSGPLRQVDMQSLTQNASTACANAVTELLDCTVTVACTSTAGGVLSLGAATKVAGELEQSASAATKAAGTRTIIASDGKAAGKVTRVDEDAGMSSRARAYDDSAMGPRSKVETMKGKAPALTRITPDGETATVGFDGLDGDG